MPQTRKEHVREAFVTAAASAFVELGFDNTTMAAVAERAGSSVGNLYKYFSSKQELFDAAVPAELVGQLSRLTRARMRALGEAQDVRQLAPNAEYHALAGELLDYCLAHRSAVIVVLLRAQGTPHAGFRAKFVESLVEWSLEYARGPYPELIVDADLRFVLRHAYESFVSGVGEVLLRFTAEARARELIDLVTHHHQGGLKRLFEARSGGSDAQQNHSPPSSQLSEPPRARARNTESAGSDPSLARPGAGQNDRASRARRRR